MTATIHALIALVVALPPPVVRQVGPDQERMLVEQAVAQYAQPRYAGRLLGYQDGSQEFVTPHEPTGPLHANYRTPEHTALLARLAGARLLTTYAGAFCKADVKEGCVEVVLRIGVPEVTGDTARVWMYVYESPKSGDWREEVDEQLLVLKVQGRWKVQSRLEIRRSYSEKVDPFIKP